MLAQSDWRSIRAADTGVPFASAWLAYRQQLRDITSQDPDDVVWPTAPAQQDDGWAHMIIFTVLCTWASLRYRLRRLLKLR